MALARKLEDAVTYGKVRALLNYDRSTGLFFWKSRPRSMFKDDKSFGMWNSRYAGKEAGAELTGGYKRIRIEGSSYLAHRLAWLYTFGQFPRDCLDHIDGDPRNNKIANLRQCSRQQNNMNMKKPITNTSGYKGVSWIAKERKWCAQIGVAKRTIFLGYFDDPAIAHAAYCKAAVSFHGEFARTA